MQEVAISSSIPLTGGAGATLYTRAEGNVLPVAERKGAPSNDIAPGWLHALGIPLLTGRDFTEQDNADHPNVILISASGAKTVFGNENPIGKTLLITSGSVPVEIVGVVGDVRSVRLDQHNDMEFYRPFAQENFPFLSITVRSPLPPERVTKSVQSALRTDRPGSRPDFAAAGQCGYGAGAWAGQVDDVVTWSFRGRRIVAREHRHLRSSRV